MQQPAQRYSGSESTGAHLRADPARDRGSGLRLGLVGKQALAEAVEVPDCPQKSGGHLQWARNANSQRLDRYKSLPTYQGHKSQEPGWRVPCRPPLAPLSFICAQPMLLRTVHCPSARGGTTVQVNELHFTGGCASRRPSHVGAAVPIWRFLEGPPGRAHQDGESPTFEPCQHFLLHLKRVQQSCCILRGWM